MTFSKASPFSSYFMPPILKQTPSDTGEGAHDVEHTLCRPLCQCHLSVVKMDASPPLTVVGRLAGKQRHETVPQVHERAIFRALT